MPFSATLLRSHLRLARRAAAASSRYYTISALNPNLSDSEQQVNNHLKVGNFDSNFSNSNEFGVLRVLDSVRDDPNLAFSFLGQLKQNGVSLNVNAYATVVKILSGWGLDRKLDSVLVELIGNEERSFCVMDLIEAIGEDAAEDKRYLLLVRVSSALVKAYVSLGMFDEAIDVLFQSYRLGCVPGIKSCNFLMNRLIEFGKNDMVLALFRQLMQIGLCANDYTYAIVVKALCREGDLDGAAKLLGETTSVFAYTTFIEGLCVNGKTEAGVALISDLIDAKALAGDELGFAYNMVVRGFCNEMKTEAAEEVIFRMEETGIGPDVNACLAIIDRHCKNMDLPKALGFVDAMLEKGLKINCVIVSSILQCYCKMGKCFEALQQFKEYKDMKINTNELLLGALQKFKEFKDMNIFLDKVCYNVAFEALSKLDRVEEAVELLQEMMNKGMVPDVINYTTLIDGYCLHGKFVDALDLIDKMRANGTAPDVITYNVLAGGLARNGHAKEAFEIYKCMKDEGLEPNAVTHNVIIEGLCFARKIEDAENFFESLEDKCPDNYASLVKGYCDSGLSKQAFRLFIDQNFPLRKSVYFKLFTSLCIEGCLDKALVVLKRMWAYGVEPGRWMYGKMIGKFCELNNAREAQLVFDTMVSRGLIPDLFTYTIMIHTYCRLNELQKAEFLFEDMKQRGIKPDVVIYTVLLDSHQKLDPDHHETGYVRGEVQKRKASEIWRELEAAGIEPDVVCYTVLIDRQCKIQNLKNATRLFDQMIDSGLKPDMVTCTALISSYCRKGYMDKAVRLVTQLSRKDISSAELLMLAVRRGTWKAKRFQLREIKG
ncbi:hypothetical protein EUTSA_v10001906mg [Eutrema salsugineum]|uniref:Pentacotripeptide-repeat region of PRORP domain-containing protein n=1 Tax=Eutrema salsugineum TaxID=72664 RepID=V4M562_EUTSA|nr:pentatricopeptide repeat-containing protein At2g26790, mitochondrial [Eutrema salsugineum]ESQ50072.1 hypothetical protein EUTSA_v10001906mg [Eutrema salsugineum]